MGRFYFKINVNLKLLHVHVVQCHVHAWHCVDKLKLTCHYDIVASKGMMHAHDHIDKTSF